jgi:TP901 family phage tail tape measure protein
MSVVVGDLLAYFRIKDEASAVADRIFYTISSKATIAAGSMARVFTPAVGAVTTSVQNLTPAINAASAAIGGGGGGGGGGVGGGGGGGGGGRGGGLAHSAQSAGYQLTLLGRGMRELGYFTTTFVTVPMVAASGYAVKLAGDFESVTQKLTGLANVADADLGKVRQQLLDMAPAVGVGPVELAKGMYAVSSTVEDSVQALDILERSAKLSAAGLGETAVVAKALTTVVKAYTEGTYDAAKAADILVKGIKMGGAEASELAPTLAKVIPFAAKLGVSFEEVSANLATITQLGVPTSEAVTSLASVFAALTRETKRGETALNTIGMSYGSLKQMIGEQGLAATIKMLADRFGLVDGRLFDVVGRIEALKNILGVTGPMAEIYAGNLLGMANAAGTAEKAFEDVQKTFNFQVKALWADIQVIGVTLGNELIPYLRAFITYIKDNVLPWVKGMISTFRELPGPMQTVALAIFALTAATGPFLKGAGLVVMGLSNIGRWLAFFTGTNGGAVAIRALLGFFGITSIPAVVAIGSVTTALLAFWAAIEIGNTETVKNAVGAWFMSAPNLTAQLGRWIAGIEKLTPEEAKLAIAATAAAEAHNKEADALKKKIDQMKQMPMMASHGGPMTPMRAISSHGGPQGALPESDAQKLQKELDMSRGMIASINREYANLNPVQKEIIRNFKEIGMSTTEAAQAAQTSVDVVEKYHAALAAGKKVADEKVKVDKKLREEMEKFPSAIKNIPLEKLVEIDKVFRSSLPPLTSWNEGLREKRRLMETMAPAWQEFLDDGGQYPRVMEDNKAAAELFAESQKKAIRDTKEASKSLNDLIGALRRLAQASKGSFSEFAGDVAGLLATFQVATTAGNELGQSFEKLSAEGGVTADNFVGLAAAAMTAVAGLMQVTDTGTTATRALKGAAYGARVGGEAFGIYGAIVGGVVGGVIGFIRGQDAAIQRIQATRRAVAELVAEFVALNPGIRDMTALFDAFGFSLIDAKNATEEWQIQLLREQMEIIREELEKINSELGDFIDAGADIGIGFPQHIQEAILKLVDLGIITGDVAAKFHSMLGAGEVDWKKMKEAADRYGISEEKLGQAFNQARMNDAAKQMINDYDILTRGGVDAGVIIDGMKDKINKLVQDSLKFGTTIPENMRPWIERMLKSGDLVDANGEKLTDLKDIKFAAPIKTEFEKLTEALQAFIDKMDALFSRMANPPTLPNPGGGGGGGGDNGDGRGGDGSGDDRGKRNSANFIGSGGAFITRGSAYNSSSTPVQIVMDKKIVADVVIDMTKGRLSVRGA